MWGAYYNGDRWNPEFANDWAYWWINPKNGQNPAAPKRMQKWAGFI